MRYKNNFGRIPGKKIKSLSLTQSSQCELLQHFLKIYIKNNLASSSLNFKELLIIYNLEKGL
jgi:hypothetical protein